MKQVNEKDWKLFRSRIPDWQEAYMGKLVEEYKALLNGSELASGKFWALWERLILSSHRKIEKCSEQKLRQTRRRMQAGLTPGKDDNEVWHNFCRNRLKISMGA